VGPYAVITKAGGGETRLRLNGNHEFADQFRLERKFLASQQSERRKGERERGEGINGASEVMHLLIHHIFTRTASGSMSGAALYPTDKKSPHEDGLASPAEGGLSTPHIDKVVFRRALMKLDLFLLPAVTFIYFLNFLDR
jgi:hypothetical protein